MSENTKPANQLLAALPAKEYQHLLPKLEEVSLTFAETIFEPNDIIRYVYFPNSGVISLFKHVREGDILEVGMVGNEGMVGLPVFLGVKKSNNQAIVQGDGTAVRIKTADFLRMRAKRFFAEITSAIHARAPYGSLAEGGLHSFTSD